MCQRTLTSEQLSTFATACEEDYYVRSTSVLHACCLSLCLTPACLYSQFEMFLDELPIWGYVGDSEDEDLLLGHTESSKHYLYTHLRFRIAYNGDAVRLSATHTHMYSACLTLALAWACRSWL